MEEQVFDSNNPTLLDAQLRLIKAGQALEGEEGAQALTEEDYTAIKEGRYASLSEKTKYWVGKFYKAGRKQHEKKAEAQRKILEKPCTIGQAHGFLNEMLHGQNGVYEQLGEWKSMINNFVLVMQEALLLKGLITPEDLEAAHKSLAEKALAKQAQIEEQAKVDVAALGEKTSG